MRVSLITPTSRLGRLEGSAVTSNPPELRATHQLGIQALSPGAKCCSVLKAERSGRREWSANCCAEAWGEISECLLGGGARCSRQTLKLALGGWGWPRWCDDGMAAAQELSPGALLPEYPAPSSCTRPGAAPTQHQGRAPSREQDWGTPCSLQSLEI